jgi:hypothetical protein
MGIFKRIEDMTSEDDRIFRQQVNKNTIDEHTLQSRGNHAQPDSPVERDCRNCFNYAHCWDFVHAPKVCPLAQQELKDSATAKIRADVQKKYSVKSDAYPYQIAYQTEIEERNLCQLVATAMKEQLKAKDNKIARLKKEVDGWMEDAKRDSGNANYWWAKCEKYEGMIPTEAKLQQQAHTCSTEGGDSGRGSGHIPKQGGLDVRE